MRRVVDPFTFIHFFYVLTGVQVAELAENGS